MDSFIEYISQPWHWGVSGVAIGALVFLMTYLGRKFGISGFYEAMCSAGGAGRVTDFFKRNLSDETWRLFFIVGAIVGGYIAANYLQSPEAVDISSSTINHLKEWGIGYPEGHGFLPDFFNLQNPKAIGLALIGGILVGFGARYGKGCTSGHAITGLSHLKIQSLVTVIGFFIGGLIMTWLIMPLIFG